MRIIIKYGMWIFLAVLALHCIAIALHLDLVRTVSKVLLMPVLLSWLWPLRARRSDFAAAALALGFAWAGDILLTGSGDLYFLCGMLAFCGTHICNTVLFTRQGRKGRRSVPAAIVAAVLLIALSAAVWLMLGDRLGVFKIPVLVYMGLIGVMAVTAAALPRVTGHRRTAFIAGASLFVVSDTLLAFNRFSWHQTTAGIAVMALYGAAQLCLTTGYRKLLSTADRK